MNTYINHLISLLAALLLAILIVAPIIVAAIVATVTIIGAMTVTAKKRKKREAAFWAQAEVEATTAFEEEEIKNYLLEEVRSQIISERLAARDEKERQDLYDSDYISGKGGKRKYIPLMPFAEGETLWWVSYSRGRDGWSRGGHSSGKRGYHDPRYKDHRNQEVRALKGLDASWYGEEVKVF